MINLSYKLKETFEEEENEIVEITAQTDKPQTEITFEKSSKPLAKTVTDIEGVAVCGFTPQSRKCIVKAIIGDESEQITVPKLNDLNEEEND